VTTADAAVIDAIEIFFADTGAAGVGSAAGPDAGPGVVADAVAVAEDLTADLVDLGRFGLAAEVAVVPPAAPAVDAPFPVPPAVLPASPPFAPALVLPFPAAALSAQTIAAICALTTSSRSRTSKSGSSAINLQRISDQKPDTVWRWSITAHEW
jgi:hypothetical protein